MNDPTLHAAQLPESVRANWRQPPGQPAAGQIWRARWQDTATLVLLREVTRSEVTAAPITAEPDLATPAALVLPAEASAIGAPLVVWDALTSELPTRVLDRQLAELTGAWTPQEGNDLAALPDVTRGVAPAGRSDPALEEQARLEDAVEALAEATWVPLGSGGLKELFDRAGMTLAQVRALPGVKQAEALALRRGERPVGGPQVDALVALTGLPADEWWSANPQLPRELVEELDQPQARARVVGLAARDRRNEVDERRDIAYGLYALAARQTGSAPSQDWAGKLAQYLVGRAEEGEKS